MDIVTYTLLKGGAPAGTTLGSLAANKADLIDGFVPASQISGQTLENYPVDTYADLPAQGNPNYLYIVHDENDQQYRWVGGSTSAYIKTGDKDAYYVAEVMGLTTMGELREFIAGINTQQLHVLLDMHGYITDAYVCTAHFYTSGGVQHCEIFDALNSQLIAGSFDDTDAISAFVAAGKSKLATVADIAAQPTFTMQIHYTDGTTKTATIKGTVA